MQTGDGEARLRAFSEEAWPPTISDIVPGHVVHVMGYGHSNASFIVADRSVILIDTLDSDLRGARLRDIVASVTDKPVGTIILTHGHPDHHSGAGAFADLDPEIIAFSPVRPAPARSGQLADVLRQRATRQFGYELTDSETISQGIGMREGWVVGDGTRAPLPPTTVYASGDIHRVIDGVALDLCAAPGETDDQMFVWYDDHKAMFCGDNYYGCWPNLYAIRGGHYRDVATWVASLDHIRSFPAEVLLPGHTRPIIGAATVSETLATFRDAIDWVLEATLAAMNAGLTMQQTVEAVRLPDRWAKLSHLQEFYGTVEWTVRSIFTGYLGWFDGNPTTLHPLPERERAARYIDLAGGRAHMIDALHQALEDGAWQWALELTDLLTAADLDDGEVRRCRAAALRAQAPLQTSANSRHYYLQAANELDS